MPVTVYFQPQPRLLSTHRNPSICANPSVSHIHFTFTFILTLLCLWGGFSHQCSVTQLFRSLFSCFILFSLSFPLVFSHLFWNSSVFDHTIRLSTWCDNYTPTPCLPLSTPVLHPTKIGILRLTDYKNNLLHENSSLFSALFYFCRRFLYVCLTNVWILRCLEENLANPHVPQIHTSLKCLINTRSKLILQIYYIVDNYWKIIFSLIVNLKKRLLIWFLF